MKIEVLGAGCANCQALEKRTAEAVTLLGLQAEIVKVTDYGDIASYGVMSTPALVVDEKVLVAGRVPRVSEIQSLLEEAGFQATP